MANSCSLQLNLSEFQELSAQLIYSENLTLALSSAVWFVWSSHSWEAAQENSTNQTTYILLEGPKEAVADPLPIYYAVWLVEFSCATNSYQVLI